MSEKRHVQRNFLFGKTQRPWSLFENPWPLYERLLPLSDMQQRLCTFSEGTELSPKGPDPFLRGTDLAPKGQDLFLRRPDLYLRCHRRFSLFWGSWPRSEGPLHFYEIPDLYLRAERLFLICHRGFALFVKSLTLLKKAKTSFSKTQPFLWETPGSFMEYITFYSTNNAKVKKKKKK